MAYGAAGIGDVSARRIRDAAMRGARWSVCTLQLFLSSNDTYTLIVVADKVVVGGGGS